MAFIHCNAHKLELAVPDSIKFETYQKNYGQFSLKYKKYPSSL